MADQFGVCPSRTLTPKEQAAYDVEHPEGLEFVCAPTEDQLAEARRRSESRPRARPSV